MDLFLPDPCIVMAIFFALIIAAFFDAVGGMIPMTVFPILLGVVLPVTIVQGIANPLDSVLGASTAFAAYMGLAIWHKGGGGDVLMMTVLGWCLGLYGIAALVIITSALYLVFSIGAAIYFKVRKKPTKILHRQYPYAPFVLAGFALYTLAAYFI